ncbi:MAG: LiaF-related protein [Blastocatellia bacterium]|nr:LiaF-related protein [Blastocatellia bacterium]
MESTIFCPKCGKQSAGDKFCRSCGTHLVPVSEALSDTEQPGAITGKRRGRTTFGIFNSAVVSNTGRSLNGHSALTVLGQVKIDLTAEALPPGETKIRVYTILGDATVLVPDDVGIRVTGISLLATLQVRGQKIHNGIDFDEYVSPDYEESLRRLHVDVGTLLGELKIKKS